jgi:hypothetical protein
MRQEGQGPRGLATIVINMIIIFLIFLMSVGMKRMTHYKKKSYGEAHIGKEQDSDDESSDSDSDGVVTMAIKGSYSSSSKFLFPNLNNGKHT